MKTYFCNKGWGLWCA